MNLKNPLAWLSLGFGSGLSPIAPGTMGSLVALIVYYFFFNSLSFSLTNSFIFLIFIMISFLIGIYIYPKTVEKDDDPRSFVWDEFVGMWVACLPLSYIESSFLLLLISFLLFRLFDILKPLGISTFDKGHGAFNVMIDDVIAGVYSAVSIIFLFTFFNYF